MARAEAPVRHASSHPGAAGRSPPPRPGAGDGLRSSSRSPDPGRPSHTAETASPALPILGLVSEPKDYTTLSGGHAPDSAMDVRVHVVFMNRLHESIPGTGSICLAAASRTPGTVVHRLARHLEHDTLALGHPSGIVPARVRAHTVPEPPGVRFDELGFSRTARRIADATASYPD